MTRPGWENTCEHGLDLASCSKCQGAAAIAAAEERGRRWKEKEMETLRGAVTLANEEIRRLVAAAHDSEERGRRRGVEEAVQIARAAWHEHIETDRGQIPASAIMDALDRHVASLAPRDSAPVCDAVLSSDPFREWRCGKPKGHEGPHSGEAPRDSAHEVGVLTDDNATRIPAPRDFTLNAKVGRSNDGLPVVNFDRDALHGKDRK